MVKKSLRNQKDILVQTLGEIVDLRTSFGKDVLKRAFDLKGPRRKALVNLIHALKRKGIDKIGGPVKFKFRGFEKGEVHERVGTSIAGPDLRFQYRYSISAQESGAVAGYVSEVGSVSSLGEIALGRDLRKELPILLPIFGDSRYSEFFSNSGRQRREGKIKDTLDKKIALAIEELTRKTGVDASELWPSLRNFFLEANLQKGTNLEWMGKQIDSKKITDDKVIQAYAQITENPEYNPKSAGIIGNAIMELRKLPSSGLIGNFRNDILFLDENPKIHKVKLDKTFVRRRFYPKKEKVKDGKLREKLKQEQLTFSESIGLVENFPGMLETRRTYNRTNALKYFGGRNPSVQKATANLAKALEVINPHFEEDKKAIHKAKKQGEKPETFLKGNYHFARRIDETRTLDDSSGDFRNLVTWTIMRDSKSMFSNLYTLGNQVKLAESVNGDSIFASGVMSTNYENDIDFKDKNGIDLLEAVKRLNGVSFKSIVDEDKKRAKQSKTTISAYKRFRTSKGQELLSASQFGIIPSSQVKSLEKYISLVKDYEENSGELKQKTEFISGLIKFCGLRSQKTDLKSLEGLADEEYISPENVKTLNEVYTQLTQDKSLSNVAGTGIFKEIAELKEIDIGNRKRFYDTSTSELAPFPHSAKTNPRHLGQSSVGDFYFTDPVKIKNRKIALENSVAPEVLGTEFIDKINHIVKYLHSQDTLNATLEFAPQVRFKRRWLINMAIDLEKNPDKILISKSIERGIENAYEMTINYEKSGGTSVYDGILTPESQDKLSHGDSFYIEAVGKSSDLRKTFSRKIGGIGQLVYKPNKGWHSSMMNITKLERLTRDLKKRNANVQLKIKRTY